MKMKFKDVGIGEGRDNPDHQPVSMEERKRDRVEAECIENRREDKVGKSLASLAAGVAGWRAGSSRVKGAGLGQAPHSVLRGGCMELLSSLKAPHACPCILGRMNSLGRHPVPMEMSPELRKTAGSAQHGHRLHHPSPHGEPRNRAGKESVGGARAPALGIFHLNSASCLCILSPPTKPGVGELQHIKLSEVVKCSYYYGETETQRYTWSQLLRPSLFLRSLKSPPCHLPELCAPAPALAPLPLP